jgi:signal transduction histidine kinase
VQQPRSLTQLLGADGSLLNFGLDTDHQGWDGAGQPSVKALQAEQEWLAAIGALVKLLVQDLPAPPEKKSRSQSSLGVVISGPFPVLPGQLMGQRLEHWLLVPEPLERILTVARPLLPGQAEGTTPSPGADVPMIPVGTQDPITQERFCLVLTQQFNLVLVLGPTEQHQYRFQFSFDPAVAQAVWQQLRDRIATTRPSLLSQVDQAVESFGWVSPDYRLVTRYSHLLMAQLRQVSAPSDGATPAPPELPAPLAAFDLPARPALAAFQHSEPVERRSPQYRTLHRSEPGAAPETGSDTELLKAMAHEIRTPLTTIRTLTRSLLKRKDVGEDVAKRLRLIDRECTQQIDRFNLIFRAVELETNASKHPRSPLSAISLNQLFEDAIPRWQQQASRRNLALTVNVPTQLPMVHSDPTMLTQVLTGLIDRFTHSLPPYSHIELAVTLAGHQLKLQFQSHPPADTPPDTNPLLSSPFKALGQLLMFQPETGGLSLNLNATKNLFQALGGKLIVRQRPQAGEVLTVFLPLETRTL